VTSWAIYAAAALLEIGGCFAFWAWLRLGAGVCLAGAAIILLGPRTA